MKPKPFILCLTALIPIMLSCSSYRRSDTSSVRLGKNKIIIRNDITKYFDACGVEGSMVIYDVKTQQKIVSDTSGIYQETLPASTFKIINLLIALETRTIADEHEIVNWVGSTDTVKYGYRPDIYRDMSVKEAFELSAGWVFVELARKIGKEQYRVYLEKCRYGNVNLSQEDADFWNFGDFAISPDNQVAFLHALYEGKLPFSTRNMNIVKNVMLAEQTPDYTIRAKTGWTRDRNINTGWWTGYIETRKGTYIFATRLLQDRKMNRSDFGNCRKEITKKVFRDLGVI